jgi:hypothetical protein
VRSPAYHDLSGDNRLPIVPPPELSVPPRNKPQHCRVGPISSGWLCILGIAFLGLIIGLPITARSQQPAQPAPVAPHVPVARSRQAGPAHAEPINRPPATPEQVTVNVPPSLPMPAKTWGERVADAVPGFVASLIAILLVWLIGLRLTRRCRRPSAPAGGEAG